MSAVDRMNLAIHLRIIEKATKDFLKGTQAKSPEQFLAEIEVLLALLDEAKALLTVGQHCSDASRL